MTRHQDNLRLGLLFSKPAQHSETVGPAHHHVAEDQRPFGVAQHLERALGGFRFVYLPVVRAQDFAYEVSY